MARKTAPKNLKANLAIEEIDALAVPKAVVAIVESVTSGVPDSVESQSRDPQARARELARGAALKAAVISGGLSLPPGPLGLLTAVPELLAIWKVQAQLVNDIAAAFGEQPPVKQENMIYCLFKNMACQVARDAVVRIAERALVRRASASLVRRMLWRCGVPIIGAAGAAAYAWFDTMQVAKRAVALFEAQQKQRQEPKPKRTRKRTVVAKQPANVIVLDKAPTPKRVRRTVAKPGSRTTRRLPKAA